MSLAAEAGFISLVALCIITPRQPVDIFEVSVKRFRFIPYEPPHDKTNKMACAPSEDSDQPGHSPSLIRVFAFRLKKAWIVSYPLSAERRLWSNWADAQADLSLPWAHSHFVGFVIMRLIKCKMKGPAQWRFEINWLRRLFEWQNQSPSLIRVFALRMKKAWVLNYPLSAQRRLWSD